MPTCPPHPRRRRGAARSTRRHTTSTVRLVGAAVGLLVTVACDGGEEATGPQPDVSGPPSLVVAYTVPGGVAVDALAFDAGTGSVAARGSWVRLWTRSNPTPIEFSTVVAWSPGRARVAIGWPGGLVTVKPDGSDTVVVLDRPALVGFQALDWSPDGEHLSFDACDYGQAQVPCGLWVVRADGTDLRLAVHGGTVPLQPAWSPDGRRFAYMRHYDERSIFVADLDGSEERRIATGVEFIAHPAWSPDGREVAYNADGEIWISTLANGSARRASEPDGVVSTNPQWSPDGRSLLYLRHTRAPWGSLDSVLVMQVPAAGGTPERRLAFGANLLSYAF